MKRCCTVVGSALLAFLLMMTSSVDAAVVLMPKQLLVIKPGLDTVAGTWVAAVKNDGDADATLSFPVLLPIDARDFSPVEGLTADQIRLGDSGLMVERSFPAGVTVVSLGFLVPARSGRASLRLRSSIDVGELTVMTPRGMLDVQSAGLTEAGADVQDMQRYSVWSSNQMMLANQTIDIDVSGVPEGRTKLWMIGGMFGAILALGGLLLTKKTAVRVQSNITEDVA